MTFRLSLLAALLVASVLPCTDAAARTRPDQVLVVYNKDWTEDLDGSAPGQDSEEIARYYVQRRTDPSTGLKPYLLGLSAGDAKPSPLNETVLKETSDDNWLGLVYKGKGTLKCDPWPMVKRGEAGVTIDQIATGRGTSRYGLLLIRLQDLGGAQPRTMAITVTPEGGEAKAVLDSAAGVHDKDNVSLLQTRAGLLLAVDLLATGKGETTVVATMLLADGVGKRYQQSYTVPEQATLPADFEPLGGKKMPNESGLIEGLFSEPDILGMMGQGMAFGILIDADDARRIDAGSIALKVGPADSETDARVIYRDGQPVDGADVKVYRLKQGQLMLSTDLTKVDPGPVRAWAEAKATQGDPYTRDLTFYDPEDFQISLTGPDGVRDDQVYLDLIENPIKQFLESTKTDDGKLLKDHILYIVVVHGMPLQVRSLYGVERGTASTTRRSPDMGAGSALTQRLRLMYYDVAKVGLAAGIMANGGRDGTRLLNVGNSLKTCMVGRRYNPYLHPLTHNVDPRFKREKVWSEGGWDAMAKLNPPRLTSELRQRMPAENFMYAVTRIDGPSVEIACNQIDGALYGERYLTPKMGPLYYGNYQEAPFAAKALAERGFDAQPAPARADRPLLYFGVFGNGAPYEQDVKDEKGFECLWRKGFYPGSTGTAIRSWLGWDRTRPPGEVNKLFEQIVRGGVTVTAGTAGGSHDTNLSWWDNFVFHHLLFSGYEFGEVTMRSMIYLDWTIDMVGDPLYAPDLAKTAPDASVPQVAAADKIRLAAVPCGNGKFAATVEVDLGNDDPEMVETHLTVWKKGEPQTALTGDNWRFNSRPHAWVGGLEPGTDYEASVTLIDPYGNRFESKEAFGPLPLRTPAAAETKVVFDKTFDSWDGGKPLTVELPNNELDDQGEIHLYYSLAEGAKESAPTIRMAGGANLLNHYSGFRIGGARMALTIERTPVLTGPGDYHVVLRWRRFPVTREIVLVKDDGSEWPLAYANTLPWDASQSVGKSLEIRGGMKVSRIRIVADAPTAPVARRGPLTDRLDIEAFRK